jgi:hypothetical protein
LVTRQGVCRCSDWNVNRGRRAPPPPLGLFWLRHPKNDASTGVDGCWCAFYCFKH